MHIETLPCPRDMGIFPFPSYANGKGYYTLRDCWHTVCGDAKLGRLRLHDLRHTAASQAVMAGENLPLVGRMLGHKRHRTTAGYAHLADAHLVKAAEKVGTIIDKSMQRDAKASPVIGKNRSSCVTFGTTALESGSQLFAEVIQSSNTAVGACTVLSGRTKPVQPGTTTTSTAVQ